MRSDSPRHWSYAGGARDGCGRHHPIGTFCLLHGNWHDGRCWDPLVGQLAARGHAAIAPDLPLDDPAAGYAERIAPALKALEGVAGPVVVVGHSVSSGYAALI